MRVSLWLVHDFGMCCLLLFVVTSIHLFADDREICPRCESVCLLGGVPTSHKDLNTSTSLVDDPGQLTVSILDCFGGQQIQLTPETQYALVQVSCAEPPVLPPNSHSYFDRVSQLMRPTPQPRAAFEDLGYKKIEDIQARESGSRFGEPRKMGNGQENLSQCGKYGYPMNLARL